MQTLKTAVVVVLFLTVLYGAYVAMNTPEQALSPEINELVSELEADGGDEIDIEIPDLPADPSTAIDQNTRAATGAVDHSASLSDQPGDDQGNSTPLADNSGTLPGMSGGFSLPPAPGGNRAADSAAPMRDSEVAQTNATGDVSGSRSTTAASPDSLADVTLPPPLPDSPLSSAAATQANPPADGNRDTNLSRAASAAGFENAIDSADRLVEKGQLREALATLSLFYGSPDLTPAQEEQLIKRLDPLAGEVIYSKAHHLETPYRVGANERLDDIAKQLDVPTQLLANINGVADPDVLLPGTELKTVRGPFRAEVDLDRRSLTLFLNDLYAGRFPIFVGNDPIPESGEYQVLDKQSGRTYYGPGGRSIPVGDPSNPYGKVWLDLGRGVCIHGSPDSAGPGVPPGCIQLSPIDARDIYAILSAGSSVTIRR